MGWVGFDLDGTLAVYDGRHIYGVVGPPVPAMVNRVKELLAAGKEVRIFTARVSEPDKRVVAREVAGIEDWCVLHIGQKLRITCVKDYACEVLYDDRARQVEFNTGRVIGEE